MVSFFVAAGSSVFVPFLGIGEKVTPSSPYCTITNKNMRLAQILTSIQLLNNMAIFVAIAIKLMPPNNEEEPARTKIVALRRLLRGQHLPELSRTLWWDGQRYII
jgi:hypothetical protein